MEFCRRWSLQRPIASSSRDRLFARPSVARRSSRRRASRADRLLVRGIAQRHRGRQARCAPRRLVHHSANIRNSTSSAASGVHLDAVPAVVRTNVSGRLVDRQRCLAECEMRGPGPLVDGSFAAAASVSSDQARHCDEDCRWRDAGCLQPGLRPSRQAIQLTRAVVRAPS